MELYHFAFYADGVRIQTLADTNKAEVLATRAKLSAAGFNVGMVKMIHLPMRAKGQFLEKYGGVELVDGNR